MQIQVHTDNHIPGDERLADYTEAHIRDALGHLTDRVTRIDAHLADENGEGKGGEGKGSDDKRCMLEAHVAGQPPIAVTHHADTVKEAIGGAVDKLEKVLGGIEDRRRDKHPARG
jgi:ribosome-associated translation inhibitor RaiA